MPTQDHARPETLFRKVPAKYSGIDFVNHVNEKLEYLDKFDYVYNGGGVAIGDINNDGLQDIFFTGNEVENKLFLNEGNLKFRDITIKAHLNGFRGWNNGVSMVDINSDGFLDIYICRGGWHDTNEQRKNLLFINQGNTTFKEMADTYGIDDAGYSTQASFFDFDNDSDLDLYVVNRPGEFLLPIPEFLKRKENPHDDYRDKLYINDHGTFIEAGKELGITNNFGYGLGVVTADINNDGYIDIFVANDFDEYDYLYLNQAGERFKESIKTATKHISLSSMGADIMDINNDGLEDIFVLDMLPDDHMRAKVSMPSMSVEKYNYLLNQGFHYQYTHNMLHLNQGNGLFSEVSKLAGVDQTDWSWAGLATDFDNDGRKDLLITNGYKRDILDNDLGLRFQDFFIKNKSKYKSGQEFIDKREDDIINLYKPIKRRNFLFRNRGDINFEDVSEQWGFLEQSFSNGASVADLDNDGDLDIVINNLDEKAFVFENTSSDSHNYLRIKFEGPIGNSFGLGAKVKIFLGKEIQYQEFKMVRGYLSSTEPIMHFGLGKKSLVDSLTIAWPGGRWQSIYSIDANQTLTLHYSNAVGMEISSSGAAPILFSDVEDKMGLNFRHHENEYNDFDKEKLLPHKYSRFGPGIATGDINNDGRDDVYICGAKGQSGAMYVQIKSGGFQLIEGPWDTFKKSEEISAVFFDADSDGKLDLYIVNGGNEFTNGDPLLKDKLYINSWNNEFRIATERLPDNAFSGSKAKPYDYDNDGDADVFVSGRSIPQNYPMPASGYLYENQDGVFKDVTMLVCPELKNLGLITDALWTDYDQDGDIDLLVVGEWMPLTVFNNTGKGFEKVALDMLGLSNTEGWWYSIEGADFDQDGDIDIIAGNLGLNYQYRASIESPFEVFSSDFDNNGQRDIILGYTVAGAVYPVRGKETSEEQLPFLNQKFQSHTDFSSATIEDMVGKKRLNGAMHLTAKTFASTYFKNNGDGTFSAKALPYLAQFSSVNDIIIDDFDNDGNLDMILSGNLYTSEIETPRNDASYGVFLAGDGKGEFKQNYPYQSGLYIDGDVKEMSMIKVKGSKMLLVSKNNDMLQVIKINSIP